MKKYTIIMGLLLITSITFAQRTAVSSGARETTECTLSSTVVAYADKQLILGNNTNVIPLSTTIPTWAASTSNTGYTMLVKLDIDSAYASPPSIELLMLGDSALVGATLATDHAEFQGTDGVGDNVISSVTVNLYSYGTWAGGARRTFGFAKVFIPYKLAKNNTKLFWIPISRSGWTPKQSGKLRLTVSSDAY